MQLNPVSSYVRWCGDSCGTPSIAVTHTCASLSRSLWRTAASSLCRAPTASDACAPACSGEDCQASSLFSSPHRPLSCPGVILIMSCWVSLSTDLKWMPITSVPTDRCRDKRKTHFVFAFQLLPARGGESSFFGSKRPSIPPSFRAVRRAPL